MGEKPKKSGKDKPHYLGHRERLCARLLEAGPDALPDYELLEFLLELLEHHLQVKAIRHEGVEMPKAESDTMIKKAAGMLASKVICSALNISPEEEHYRFGFTA